MEFSLFKPCYLEMGNSIILYSTLLLLLSCFCIYRQKLNIKSATSNITFCPTDPKSQLKTSEARIFSSQFNTIDSIRTSSFLSFFFFPNSKVYSSFSVSQLPLPLLQISCLLPIPLPLCLLPPTPGAQIATMSLKVGCISKY